MKKKQFQPLTIVEFKEKAFHLPFHGQTYYELVYILEGSGLHIINNTNFRYSAGDLFTVCPGDEHYFEIELETRFLFILFTDSYFGGYIPYQFKMSPENLLKCKILKEIKLEFCRDTKEILMSTMQNLLQYTKRNSSNLESSAFINSQITSILGLIIDYLISINISLTAQQAKPEELTAYIHENIYYPEIVQIKNTASHFNISAGYFGTYFKKSFGIAYSEYLSNYKIELIKKRLLNPGFSMKMITNEFSFSDQSHFYHFFRKRVGISPTQYRKEKK
ncbi:AraC family transcriptional regulator [Pedobacter nyackensis]|uniref:helix-turn-helix domain-containing protein n=1 Tax=Pedobacter nyackensis TaxID=475255 RepID=UPI002930E2B5|nr:AraC family transcriptional regulator [Pedobacter nyackensis]